jgi:hypothetical protein
VQEIATVPQDAASLHGHVPGDLLHPQLIRVNGDPGDDHSTALEIDEEQHVVGHQPAQREHFRGEKVGPGQQRQVCTNEARHVVVHLRSGAGGKPCRCRTLPIV